MIRTSEVESTNGTALFILLEGVVANHQTQRWAETHVSSSGGGGYVHPGYGGHVSGGAVSSSVVRREHTQFWLTDENGIQHAVQLSNETMPTANGHKVRVIWGRKKSNANGTMLYARNYASQSEVTTSDDELMDWAKRQNLLKYPAIYRLIFYYLPVLFVLYLTFVWAPLIPVMVEHGILPYQFKYKSDTGYLWNAFMQHFQHLELWTPKAMSQELFSGGISGKGIMAMIVYMVLFQFIARVIGRIFIGTKLKRRMLIPLRKGLDDIISTPSV